jgi:hypothetical protein
VSHGSGERMIDPEPTYTFATFSDPSTREIV